MRSKYWVIILSFLYLFLIYDVNFHGPDEPVYYGYTKSIVEDGDLNLANQVYYNFGKFVSSTYNSPDFHNYGGVIVWLPFYLYAKLIYLVTGNFYSGGLEAFNPDQLAKCAMSFGTVLSGLIIIILSFMLCRRFYPRSKPAFPVIAILLGTPFFYYMLFEAGNANMIGSLFSVLSIWFCLRVIDGKRLDWFLYGLLFSVAVSVRAEIILQACVIVFMFIILRMLKKADWRSGVYFLSGFFIIFILRSINAVIKYGSFRPEEMFYIISFLRYRATYNFNGLSSSFRGIFYTSPVLYVCLAGFVMLIKDIFRNFNKNTVEDSMRQMLLLSLSLYAFLKTVLIGIMFSPAGDSLSARLLLTEIPIFILLYARVAENRRKYIRFSVIGFTLFSLAWNLMVISEYITGLDWPYITGLPGIALRIKPVKYIFDVFFYIKDPGMKMALFSPILLIALGVFLYIVKRLRYPGGGGYMLKNKNSLYGALYLFAIYSSIAYLSITLLNMSNNQMNVEKMKKENIFDNARLVSTLPMRMNEYEEEEHLWSLFKMSGYYALKGDIKMANNIKNLRERIFGKRSRIRFHALPVSSYNSLAGYYISGGRYGKAIQCYNELLRIDPNDFEAYFALGDIYIKTGQYDKAIGCFKDGADIVSGNPMVYSRIAEAYQKLGDYEKAVEYYKKVIQLNPHTIDVYLQLGYIYHYMGYYDKAIGCFDKVTQFSPGHIDAYLQLALMHKDSGDYEKAVEYYKKVIQLNPGAIDSYTQLGYIYNNTGEYRKAIECFNNIIRLNPDAEDAYFQLGYIYNNTSEYGKAIKYFGEVRRLNPDRADIYVILGHIYGKTADKNNLLKQIMELKRLKRDNLAGSLRRYLN
jgi:tetratricopeptide (TPR) repeat protein